MINVVMAGGGTAGHTSPLIATAEALARKTDVNITCIGTARGLETKVIPEAGLDLQLIPAVPMPRRPNLDLAKLPFRLRGAVAQAKAIITEHQADVVVGFGGYVAMPAYLGARSAGVPFVIHEQNAVPGMANRAAAKLAAHVLTSFPSTPLPGAQFVGLPVRTAVADLAAAGRESLRGEARAHFGLHPELPTLLVSGGSQGARSLNNATMGAKSKLLAADIQILHVWGRKNFTDDLAVEINADTGAGYYPVAYVEQMELAYAAADLMLARSGAGTVVETAVIGLPAIFVPLPIGNGEQARNAADVVAAGAAIPLPDQDLNPQRLVDEVIWRITDPRLLGEMSRAGRELMPADAADKVADIVIDVATNPPPKPSGSWARGGLDVLTGKLRKGKP